MGNYYSELYFGSIHILVVMALFCALLLWSQRGDGQRSRRFLAWTWFFLLCLYIARLLKLYYHNVDMAFEGVFLIGNIVFGVSLVAIMTIYPIEVVAPQWLNRKRLSLLFSPVLLVFVVCGAIQFFGGGFRTLDTAADIARYGHEPNVWIRFPIILLVYGYAFILYYIPHNKMRGNTTLSWIRTYTLGNLGIGLFYLGLMLFGTYPTGISRTLFHSLCGIYHLSGAVCATACSTP